MAVPVAPIKASLPVLTRLNWALNPSANMTMMIAATANRVAARAASSAAAKPDEGYSDDGYVDEEGSDGYEDADE